MWYVFIYPPHHPFLLQDVTSRSKTLKHRSACTCTRWPSNCTGRPISLQQWVQTLIAGCVWKAVRTYSILATSMHQIWLAHVFCASQIQNAHELTHNAWNITTRLQQVIRSNDLSSVWDPSTSFQACRYRPQIKLVNGAPFVPYRSCLDWSI